MTPGSFLVVSHATAGDLSPDAVKQVEELYAQATAPGGPPLRPEIARFFGGLKLVPPGIAMLPAGTPTHCLHHPAGRSSSAAWEEDRERCGGGGQVAS
jgi:S-adenosyl methyltransferase